MAAEHSAQVHIRWVDHPFRRVLAVLPRMYDDLWTGAKGMYKCEPAIVEGGEIILYAPHISEASYSHKTYIDEIGYHCCEYFLKQWHRFAHIPLGVMAHSTHLRGQGSYDAVKAREWSRIQVTVASSISEQRCRQLNLNYLDPKTVSPEQWRAQAGEGMMLVPDAGEILYRLKTAIRAEIDSRSTQVSEEATRASLV